MPDELLNKSLLPGNLCYGCGHDNPAGLKIEVYRDPEEAGRLLGRFEPSEQMIGFPGITHGGGIYTALDCMASWTPTVLRPQTRAAWILREAGMSYLRPARQGEPMDLVAWIEEEGGPWEPMTIATEARDGRGEVLAEGRFKVVPLSPDRLKKVADVDRLPENWSRLLEEPRD